MKKIIVGALVGGILIFIWQTLSWTILDLHRAQHQYTPKQEAIMTFLNSQFTESGSYSMPNTAPGASNEEMNKLMKDAMGKPWATVSWHKEFNMNMGMNIFRGVIVDIVMAGFFCWIISGFANPRIANVFFAGILTGLIAFISYPYTVHIWYETFDLSANLIDALVGWGIAGLFIGWWYDRQKKLPAVGESTARQTHRA